MYLNIPNFKPYPGSSALLTSFDQENQLKPNSIPFSEQGSNPSQYVGDDAGDYSTHDSTLSKCTKCTIDSQSDIMEDFDLNLFPFNVPQKSSLKQLKKEMKKQKIKRKQFEKINLNLKNSKINLFPSIQSINDQSCSLHKICIGKQNENSINNSLIQDIEIQKSTSNCFVNLWGRKKVHTETNLKTVKNNLPFLSLFQLEQVKTLRDTSKDLSYGKQNLFQSQQTRIIQQSQILQQVYKNSNFIQTKNTKRYFIDDLVEQVNKKKSGKVDKKNCSKLNFIQSLINHSEKYQLPIETARPKDEMIQKIHLERRDCDAGKKTLLIDLDDTLIFTSNPLKAEEVSPSDLTIAQSDGRLRKLNLRPYALEFLQQMSYHYEIIIFTAATKCYAEQIRKILDPENIIISHLLDRQFCFNPNNVNKKYSGLPYIKDLRCLNRDLKETILLDNSIYSFWYQINNGIPIVSYNKEKQHDQELIKVQSYLMELIQVDDVRVFNQQYFRLEQYEQHVDAKILVKELYIQRQQDN